ncbi:hypothetical protein CEXT_251051 [Caerostris extrusa]|uniref:Uncharacterized protein n=1 Tax=Caerostris extrusa TaxID=172846 RepID=A0AAV4M7S9_CAEEX|nr:hypothetical protein CEXT_251051 [Caerostris extrusa]
MMYRMILIDSIQDCLQRRFQLIIHLRRMTVIWSCECAISCYEEVKTIVDDEANNFLKLYLLLHEVFCMDDVLCGASILKEGKELQRKTYRDFAEIGNEDS